MLLRARPLPASAEMVIEDLADDESAAYLAALRRSPGCRTKSGLIDIGAYRAALVPNSAP